MPSTTALRRLTGPMSKRLRTARDDAGLTQEDVAELTGLALKTVNNYENPNYGGRRKFTSVKAIAEACGRNVAEIWGSDSPTGKAIARTTCRVQSLSAA